MRKALGKGLDALFPGQRSAEVMAPEHSVPIDDVAPNPEQPRRHFDDEALAALASSIARHGLLQPLVVRRLGGSYELIAGERRLRAARRAGLAEVPIVVREAPSEHRLELALIENLQRENLTALEEAEAYQHLIERYGLTQEQLAVRVGKSRPAITNALRLLSLPEPVKAQLENGQLSAGHARAVLGIAGADEQVAFAQEISERRLPKSAAERLAGARRTKPAKGGRSDGATDLHLKGIADELTRSFGTRVRIARRSSGGAVEIEFYSDAELDRIVERLRIAGATRA